MVDDAMKELTEAIAEIVSAFMLLNKTQSSLSDCDEVSRHRLLIEMKHQLGILNELLELRQTLMQKSLGGGR